MSDLIRKIDILMNGVSMGRVSSVRELRSDVFSLEAELKEEKLQHGFTQISLDSTKTHLNACESALSDRDTRIASLEAQLKEREWQDMESAPKGGGADRVDDDNWVTPPRILLLFNNNEQGVCYWDWYYAEGGRGYNGLPAWILNGEQAVLSFDEPIGWMPLPSPPKEQGQ